MPDWERLGKYVVAARVQRGYKQRTDFARAAQIGLRVLSDIENGRRDNFDAATIATLEHALGWETGSVDRVILGGEPILRDHTTSTSIDDELHQLMDTPTRQRRQDEALIRVMRSDLPDAKKRQIVRMLIAEREAAERARLERADQLIHLVRDDDL